MPHTLANIVKTLASTPVLLVASDFDGTLAPLVDHHDRAVPDAEAVGALVRLSRVPHTHVAVVSGRGLSDLRRRLGEQPRWELSGSHGAEIAGEVEQPMLPEALEQLRELSSHLESIAAQAPGCVVERKPRGVAFHYRGVSDPHAGSALAAVTSMSTRFSALTMRLGSMVIEFLADKITKGDGLRHLRHRTGASAVIFIGDDLSDEHAFVSLGPSDVGVKVGSGDTRAQFRVTNVEEVARLLTLLADERERWMQERPLTPITAHAVLSDQRTLAVVTPNASVAWLCLPRVDSPPVFAELLGGPEAGFFQITPVDDPGSPLQQYDGDSLILRTRWRTCTVTDYLDCGSGRAFQRAGRTDLIRVIEGQGTCRVRFAPRLDFGRVATRLLVRENGLEVEGSSDPILLYSPGVRWEISENGPHQTAEARVTLAAKPIVFELRAGSSNDRPHFHPEAQRRQATERFWSTWAGSLRLPTFAAEHVRRSAIMLRALVYGPTGAISAAATTSLPEHLGGQRNWDYRYCWPRDAAMAAASLVRIGNTGTAMRFLDWLARVLEQCESPGRLRPIYAVDGRDLGPEAEISGLAGYGGSRPVRVGNAAALQVQLDVFGPITDLIALLAESGAPISPDHWRLTRAMVDAVEARWQEPDHGIWEIRGDKSHHLHSKVMCFHTVNRALIVHDCVIGRPNPAWETLRDTIRADVLARGFNATCNSFTGTYGGRQLDAAALSVGLTGLLEVTDPRFVSTVDAVDKNLRSNGTVYRYRFDDGLPGREGGFHLCTGWLIESFARAGRLDAARGLFDDLLRSIGPTGVLSEQIDPELDMPLGNAPQAYSHLAVINAALALDHLGVPVDATMPALTRAQTGEHT
jgi:trehalose 6-phosphate phosphatase